MKACWSVGMLMLFTTAASALAETWPAGLSFVALAGERWQLYLVAPGTTELQAVHTASEPRTPTYNAKTGKVAYMGADGNLHETSLADGTDRVLLKASAQETFTQPAYDDRGERLFVVVLKEGNSADTDIMALAGNTRKSVVQQRFAQFEPYFHEPYTLYYSNVLCVVGCGKIIQEIWRINLITEDAEQLTRINAIARQPVVSKDGQRLYFSSNQAGNFHIWQLELATNRYQRLTDGWVSDLSPALDSEETLYFIRQSPEGTRLMRLNRNGALRAMTLPEGIEEVRDLEIDR